MFLGRGVTTVQRWEQEEGLPIHRHAHARRGTIFAFKSELDAWRNARTIRDDVASGDPVEPVTDQEAAPRVVPVAVTRGRGVVLAAASLAAALVLVAAATLTPTVGPDIATPALARPLSSDAAYEAYPSLSPDGRFVAYRWSLPEAPGIYIRPTSGGEAWPLPVTGGPLLSRKDYFPQWSPDGLSIAFLRELGASVWDLYVVPVQGGEPHRVTEILSGDVSWMPDSARVAVVDKAATGEPYSVFIVDVATGRRLRRVTSPPPGTFGDWHCAVSRDGSRLALARFRSDFDADVYVTTVAGGEADIRRVTHDAVRLEHLTWSPDGTTIVFSSTRSGRSALWEVSADPQAGASPRLVAGADEAATYPSLSRPPAGQPARLVYMAKGATTAVWRWDQATTPRGEPRVILSAGTQWDDHPAWSPDGTQVAFVSNRTGQSELWTADADGRDPRQVTFRQGPLTVQPRWSPDGRWILFTSIAAGQQDLYKVHPDGSELARVTFEPSSERNGSWSRDGASMYFRSDRNGSVRVWRMDASRRTEAVPATHGESSEARESLDGKTLYFTRSYEAGLWQKPLPDGPETLLVPDWHVREGLWDVTADGIIILGRQVSDLAAPQPLILFSFQRRALVPLGHLPAEVSRVGLGISARPDGALLWSQTEPLFDDLKIVDLWLPSGR